jgi:ribosomal protein S18 acetylase RimI-like enzyme
MIRPFTDKDRPTLIQLFRLNSPRYFDPAEEDDYIEYLDTHPDSYFVLEWGGKVWGAGGYHCVNEETGRLSWFIIHPARKGIGYGTGLVKHCLNALSQRPAMRRATIWTSQLAAPFFQRFGFHTREIKNNYWGDALDLYLMEKEMETL